MNDFIRKLQRLHEIDEHEAIIDEIERLEPEQRDYEILGYYARALNNLGREHEALEILLGMEEFGIYDATWHYRIGFALYYLGREEEAATYLRRAVDLGDNEEDTLELLEMAESDAEKRRLLEADYEQRWHNRVLRITTQPFARFDEKAFWGDLPADGIHPTESQISDIEDKLGYRLPRSYKWMIKRHNGGLPLKNTFAYKSVTGEGFEELILAELYTLDNTVLECDSFVGMGVPIASCYSDFIGEIFLDYTYCGTDGEPAVVAIDIVSGKITYLADDFESFIRGLTRNEMLLYGAEVYDDPEWDAVECHIKEQFGEFNHVFHELVSPDIHVDICVIEPTRERDFYTLVTIGMGAHLMNVPEDIVESRLDRAELLITLPPDWDVRSDEERWYWPLRWLKQLARLPLKEDSWLGWGHTVPADEPFADNTELCCMMLSMPYVFGQKSAVCTLPDDDEVNFYQLIPLYKSEMEFKLKNSAEELEDLFPDDFDMVVDIARDHVV